MKQELLDLEKNLVEVQKKNAHLNKKRNNWEKN